MNVGTKKYKQFLLTSIGKELTKAGAMPSDEVLELDYTAPYGYCMQFYNATHQVHHSGFETNRKDSKAIENYMQGILDGLKLVDLLKDEE